MFTVSSLSASPPQPVITVYFILLDRSQLTENHTGTLMFQLKNCISDPQTWDAKRVIQMRFLGTLSRPDIPSMKHLKAEVVLLIWQTQVNVYHEKM